MHAGELSMLRVAGLRHISRQAAALAASNKGLHCYSAGLADRNRVNTIQAIASKK